MLQLTATTFAKIDTKIRAKGVFTYLSIENAIREFYELDDSDPDAFDEIHEPITEFHSHYVSLGLAVEGV